MVIVLTRLPDQPQLVFRVHVIQQRSKPAETVLRVVNHLASRGLQSQVAAVAVDAGVVRKFFRVSAEIQLIIGLKPVSKSGHQFGLVVALKARPRHHVEFAIRPVAQARIVAAALHLQIIDVLRVDLRP